MILMWFYGPAIANRLSSSLKENWFWNELLWICIFFWIYSKVDESHTIKDLSALTEIKAKLLGENITKSTVSRWPWIFFTQERSDKFHTLTDLSWLDEISTFSDLERSIEVIISVWAFCLQAISFWVKMSQSLMV